MKMNEINCLDLRWQGSNPSVSRVPTSWFYSVLEAALHRLIFGRLTRRESAVLHCGVFSCIGATVELLIRT